jgi:hypothetical protein
LIQLYLIRIDQLTSLSQYTQSELQAVWDRDLEVHKGSPLEELVIL